MNHDIHNKDLISISEFARIVGLTPELLRRYDNEEIFCAYKRGGESDSETSSPHGNMYRLYSPTQITRAKSLRFLFDLDIKPKEMKEFDKNRSVHSSFRLLKKQQVKIHEDMNFMSNLNAAVAIKLKLLVEGMGSTEDELSVLTAKKKRIIIGSENHYTQNTGFYRELMRFCDSRTEPLLNIDFPMGGYFDDMDAFVANPTQPNRFFSIDPKGFDVKKKGLYLVGHVRGYYGETHDIPKQMIEYAKSNGLEFCGPVYCIYHDDEMGSRDKNNFLTQISASVRRTHSPISRRLKNA